MKRINKAFHFDPKFPGEAHQIDGFKGEKIIAECIAERTKGRWTRSVSKNGDGYNAIRYRPLRSWQGIVYWLASIGCTEIEVHVTFTYTNPFQKTGRFNH